MPVCNNCGGNEGSCNCNHRNSDGLLIHTCPTCKEKFVCLEQRRCDGEEDLLNVCYCTECSGGCKTSNDIT